MPPPSPCFSTAVQDLLLKTRVRTQRGGPKQHGVPVLHPCHPHGPELEKICTDHQGYDQGGYGQQEEAPVPPTPCSDILCGQNA